MKKKTYNNNIIYIGFLFYLIIGFFTYKNYGINIEEHFQRWNGFFWLDYILSFTNFIDLKVKVKIILDNLYDPSLNNIPTYGPIFDANLALIETIFNISSSKLYFEIRHLSTFLLFFLSAVCFYKIVQYRFKKFNIIIFSTLAYVITPRIYGDSFHNNKDIIFLSLITFTIYFLFKFFNKHKYKNLLLFSFFLALSTSIRIMGVFIPVVFLLTYIFSKKNKNIYFLEIIVFFLLYFVFLVIFWPYLWSDPVINFYNLFNNIAERTMCCVNVLFDGQYYTNTQLPDSYLVKWMAMTYPVPFLALIIFGIIASFKRLLSRLFKLGEKNFYNDLWRGQNEKKDFFCLVSFVGILFFATTFSLPFISGWRHFYFLHFFSSYFVGYAIYTLVIIFEKKN